MSSVDLPESSLVPHLLGADVGVAAGAVPVALHGFGVQCGHNPKVFTDAVQQKTGDPQMVAHLDAFARTDLELPLKKHEHGRVREEWKPSMNNEREIRVDT